MSATPTGTRGVPPIWIYNWPDMNDPWIKFKFQSVQRPERYNNKAEIGTTAQRRSPIETRRCHHRRLVLPSSPQNQRKKNLRNKLEPIRDRLRIRIEGIDGVWVEESRSRSLVNDSIGTGKKIQRGNVEWYLLQESGCRGAIRRGRSELRSWLKGALQWSLPSLRRTSRRIFLAGCFVTGSLIVRVM